MCDIATRRQLRLGTGWAWRRPTRWLYRSFRSWRALKSGWMVSRALAVSGRWWAWSMCFMLTTTAAQMSHTDGTLVMGPRTSLYPQIMFTIISHRKYSNVLSTCFVSVLFFFALYSGLKLINPQHMLLSSLYAFYQNSTVNSTAHW